MSTERFAAPTGAWVKVISANIDDFLLENETFSPILVTYTELDVAPTADAPGHFLRGREAMVRIASGDIHVKAATDVESTVVVTAG